MLCPDDKVLTPGRGKMKIHMVQNHSKILEFLKAKGVQLVNIGAEDLVDGKYPSLQSLLRHFLAHSAYHRCARRQWWDVPSSCMGVDVEGKKTKQSISVLSFFFPETRFR